MSVKAWVGGWGLCGRLGPNEKLHNSAWCASLPFRKADRTLEMGRHTTCLKHKRKPSLTCSDFILLKTSEGIFKTWNNQMNLIVTITIDSNHHLHWCGATMLYLSQYSQCFHSPLTSDFRVYSHGSSIFFSLVVLFFWHHKRQGNDVLCLLHRGHVNHAATEGESTLSSTKKNIRPELHSK